MLPQETKLYAALTRLQRIYPSLSAEKQIKAQELICQARELHENEPVRFFEPNTAQQKYIDAVGKPGAYIVIFAAGNGVGKTAATCALISAIIWPGMASADIFGGEIFKKWPYPKDFRIISTPQELQEGGSIQREIKRWFPKDKYDANKNGKPYISQYLANGFTINLMSFDMAPEAFEGSTNGLVVFNEPAPQEIFNACAARMRRGGLLLFPMTPLMDAAWIMDKLVSKADGKEIQLVAGDIEDNCREHSKHGLLKHEDIDKMIRNYDPDEIEARKSGKFMHLSGTIYKTFDRAVHIAKEEIIPPDEGVAHYMVLDPAIGKPLAVLWSYVDHTKTIHIYDEYPSFEFQGAKDSNLTVKDYADEFKRREAGRRIQDRIMDRHFGNVRRTLGGQTLKQEFSMFGVDFTDSYSMDASVEVETGILKVKEYLRYDKDKPLDSLNGPKLIISPTCRNTISSFERWSRDPSKGKPNEDYKDFADCVRYLVMSNPEIEIRRAWNAPKPAYYGVGT